MPAGSSYRNPCLQKPARITIFFHVQGMAVCIRIDGHRGYAGLGAGANDADGDFTAIGNKDFLDHAVTCEEIMDHI